MLSCCLNALTRWNETKIGKVSKVRSTGYRTRNHSPDKMYISPNAFFSATFSVSVFSGAAGEPRLSSLKSDVPGEYHVDTYVIPHCFLFRI
jgi:hypothetical protein